MTSTSASSPLDDLKVHPLGRTIEIPGRGPLTVVALLQSPGQLTLVTAEPGAKRDPFDFSVLFKLSDDTGQRYELAEGGGGGGGFDGEGWRMQHQIVNYSPTLSPDATTIFLERWVPHLNQVDAPIAIPLDNSTRIAAPPSTEPPITSVRRIDQYVDLDGMGQVLISAVLVGPERVWLLAHRAGADAQHAGDPVHDLMPMMTDDTGMIYATAGMSSGGSRDRTDEVWEFRGDLWDTTKILYLYGVPHSGLEPYLWKPRRGAHITI